MELTAQRGAVAVPLDKPRILFFDMPATWLLIQRYGKHFVPALYKVTPQGELELQDIEALAYFLWAGLQAECKLTGDTFTLEQAADQIRPFSYVRIFNAVVVALVGGTSAPPGKTAAAGAAAEPAANAPADPGPTRVSTSSKRSGSPTASSAGRNKPSGRRR
jgi:hypothetical protein